MPCKGFDFCSLHCPTALYTISTAKLLWRFETTPAGDYSTEDYPCRGLLNRGLPLQGTTQQRTTPAGDYSTEDYPCRGLLNRGLPLQGTTQQRTTPAGDYSTEDYPCRGLLNRGLPLQGDCSLGTIF